MNIDELAVKVASQVAGATPVPGAGPVVEALLRELLQVQDQQMALLAKIEADVQRLVDGPWRTGRRYLREAALPGRSAQQKGDALSRAMECFRQAVDLQPGSTFKRATVSLDLAVLCALTGDTELSALYAAESEKEAKQALELSVKDAWKQRYGARSEILNMAAFIASSWTSIPFNVRMRKLYEGSGKLRVQGDQYKAVRAAAIALGADLPGIMPPTEPERPEPLPERVKQQAGKTAKETVAWMLDKRPR